MLHGNKRIANFLLDHGATPVVFSDIDDFASACLAGDADRTQQLIRKDDQLLQKLGDRKVELLQLAAESGKFEAIRLMANLGFELNAVQRTAPLHHAAMSGDLKMAKILIELGANPLVRDTEFDATPRGWAEYGDKKDVAEFLSHFEPGD